jgi:hypothetical protein
LELTGHAAKARTITSASVTEQQSETRKPRNIFL